MNDPIAASLSSGLSLLNSNLLVGAAALQLQIARAWEEDLARPRNQDPRRLLRHGAKVHSQNDEDGIIEEIFRRVPPGPRTFIEFGAANGVENNTMKLLIEGWRGLWIEGSRGDAERIAGTHRSWLDTGHLALLNAFVTAEGIDALLRSAAPDPEIDLLGIDIDYNDYWVWQAIESVRPKVVVIEYNAFWRPPLSVTVPYDPAGRWAGDSHFGASLEALHRLGRRKGYHLVGCCYAGVNAFFVREDLCGDRFLIADGAAGHYEPARYHFRHLTVGHPRAVGPLVGVP